jgi:hypothetical protein
MDISSRKSDHRYPLPEVVDFESAVSESFLAGNFDRRVPEVHRRVETAVNPGEGGGLVIGIAAVAADAFADTIAVFLFDKAGVIFAAGAAAGKPDAVVITPLFDLGIDEFAAVIAIQP